MIWWLRKQLLRLKLTAFESFQYEAESLVIWYAVLYAMGIAAYLVMPWELPTWGIVLYFELLLVLVYFYRNRLLQFRVLTYLLIFTLGLCVAKADALYINNKLEHDLPEVSYLNGLVTDISFNEKNHRTKITLAHVHNFDKDLKGNFLISINQKLDWLKVGKCVELVAQMPKTYEPDPIGNFDFNRHLFYQNVSASGYAISPVFESFCENAQVSNTGIAENVRQKFKNTIKSLTNDDTGGIILALVIGDKTQISPEIIQAYRTSGLAHVLAISGMHMGLIALLIFFLLRVLFLPWGRNGRDIRKPAAIFSLIGAYGYLLISGQSVSCLRAFVMTALILLAVLLNRRPISLRIWGLAVVIVCTISPSAVILPGFLMSFAAVLGIISFYEKYKNNIALWFEKRTLFGKISAYFIGIILTDLVASLMTFPYSMYFFHQISVYTTLGNLLATPIIAFIIMPSLLLFLLLGQTGIAYIVIKPFVFGVRVLNEIAEYVSGLDGAHSGEFLPQLPDWGILFITLGLLWLCIWQEKWRIWGFVLVIFGILSLFSVPSIDFVFDKGGKTFACRGENNLLISTPWHKNRFFNRVWTNGEKGKDENLVCDNEKCICRKEIEFSKGSVKYNGRNVRLDAGGFIDIRRGIYYKKNNQNRFWNIKKHPAL